MCITGKLFKSRTQDKQNTLHYSERITNEFQGVLRFLVDILRLTFLQAMHNKFMIFQFFSKLCRALDNQVLCWVLMSCKKVGLLIIFFFQRLQSRCVHSSSCKILRKRNLKWNQNLEKVLTSHFKIDKITLFENYLKMSHF